MCKVNSFISQTEPCENNSIQPDEDKQTNELCLREADVKQSCVNQELYRQRQITEHLQFACRVVLKRKELGCLSNHHEAAAQRNKDPRKHSKLPCGSEKAVTKYPGH